jgi:predicted Zn-dependent protease with MMP-like domain
MFHASRLIRLLPHRLWYNCSVMGGIDFDEVIRQTLDEFPRDLQRSIANVAIVVEEFADDETLELAELDDPLDLLGFYHGIPLTERTHSYGLILPDKISIYRQPILNLSKSDDQIRTRIRQTVRHELAHYFGIDDERLEELGAY